MLRSATAAPRGLEASDVRWIPLLLLPLFAGCIGVDITGIEGFSASSAQWVVSVDGTLRTHSFVLSDAADYCSKLQASEQERIDATARHEARLADGAGVCESTDLLYDDLAEGTASLDYEGAALLTLVLDRGEELSDDARSAPVAGTFQQRGASPDGRFGGDLVYRNGSYTQGLADAYTCEDPETFDVDLLAAFQETEEVDLVDRWTLDSGTLIVSEGGDDAWSLDVDADLLDGGSNSVGTVSTSFTASKCEVATSR